MAIWSHTFTLWYCSAVNFSVQMGATGTYPRSRDGCCIRKGREFIPLSDGLITTTGLKPSCSHTSFRKPAGASSPTAAGAWADLDRPSPVDRWIKRRLICRHGDSKRVFLQEFQEKSATSNKMYSTHKLS